MGVLAGQGRGALIDSQQFFPGSRQPLVGPAGVPAHLTVPEGKKFTIGGVEHELFGIGEVAEVLNRRPVTLRKWEREGIIPKATFVKPGENGDVRGRRRLYSRPQVEAMLRIAMEEKIFHNTGLQISRTRFTEKIFAAFKELQA